MYIDEALARANEGEKVVGKILDDALDILESRSKSSARLWGITFSDGVLQVQVR
jgi:hypothetical protein